MFQGSLTFPVGHSILNFDDYTCHHAVSDAFCFNEIYVAILGSLSLLNNNSICLKITRVEKILIYWINEFAAINLEVSKIVSNEF